MEREAGATLERASKPSWKADMQRIHMRNLVRLT